LNAYDSTTNSLHYITRFIDGLFPDIHVVLLVHQPSSLDTAYTLALLQEEAGEPLRKEFRQADYANVPCWQPKGIYVVSPPQVGDKAQVGIAEKLLPGIKTMNRKLADLKAYHRAHGLCDHYGEKWSHDHKCVAQVGLHVLDELYALFASEDYTDNLLKRKSPSKLASACLWMQRVQHHQPDTSVLGQHQQVNCIDPS
jgi:hypothetical protein